MSKLIWTIAAGAAFYASSLGVGLAQTTGNAFPWLSPQTQAKATIPEFYISGGYATLRRSRPDGAGAIVAANPGGAPFLTGDQYNFKWNPGIDITAGIRFWHTDAIEVRFLSIKSSADVSMVTPGNFIGAGFTGPGGTRFDTVYTSNLKSVEVNLRHEFFDHFTVIAGLRNINIYDDLDIRLNTNVARGDYKYENKLFGAQIGLDVALLPKSFPFQVNVFGKIGKYNLESAGGIYEFQGVNPIGGFDGSANTTTTVKEAGVSAAFRVTNNISIFGGYQMLWIDKVALASNAASVSLLNPSLLRDVENARGNLRYQGAKAGLTVSLYPN
jgi:hypothetical protein